MKYFDRKTSSFMKFTMYFGISGIMFQLVSTIVWFNNDNYNIFNDSKIQKQSELYKEGREQKEQEHFSPRWLKRLKMASIHTNIYIYDSNSLNKHWDIDLIFNDSIYSFL